jgi:hypothetical protein
MILPQLCFAVDQISVSLYFDELKCFGHLMVKYLFDGMYSYSFTFNSNHHWLQKDSI